MKTIIVMILVLLLTGCGATSGAGSGAGGLPTVTITTQQPATTTTDPSQATTTPTATTQTGTTNSNSSGAASTTTDSTITPGAALKLTSSTCTDPKPNQVLSGVTMMACDGSTITGTLTVPVMPDLTNLVSANVRSGVVIAGITGTMTSGSTPPDCTVDGQTGCNATLSFKAVNMSRISDGSNIKNGFMVAGITGGYNGPYSACSSDGQVNCVASSSFKAVDNSLLTAGNIKNGIAIAGVTGSYNGPYSACASDGQVSCVANSSFKAADATLLIAGNIKSGITIAGTSGAYPSSSYHLTGATAVAALDYATFTAKIKSSTPFEWFDASGNRYQYQGDANITGGNILNGVSIFGTSGTIIVPTTPNASDIRIGVSVDGVTGTLRTTCRNDGNGAVGENCSDQASWTDLTTGGCTSGKTNCIYKDNYSRLNWGPYKSLANYAAYDSYCSTLNLNGITGWRVPSFSEAFDAFARGIGNLPIDFVNGANHNFTTRTSTIYAAGSHQSFSFYLLGDSIQTTDSLPDYGVHCVK